MLTTLMKLFSNSSADNRVLSAAAKREAVIAVEDNDNCISWIEIDRTFSEMLLGVRTLTSDMREELETSSLASIHEQYLQNDLPENLVPRLPAIVPKLMLALRGCDASATDLANLLSNDVVLVGQVLKLANSAYYSRLQIYESLEQAIVNIGFDGIRQIIVSAAMKPILNSSKGHFANIASTYLWDKSSHAGLLSDCAAKKLLEDRFHAYLASLTMQSGMTMLSRELDKHFSRENAPRDREFVDTLNSYALEISARISKQWQFPEAVSNALHEQLTADDPTKMSKLGAIIFLSDKLAKIQLLTRNGYLKTFDTDITKQMPAGMGRVFSDCVQKLDMIEE